MAGHLGISPACQLDNRHPEPEGVREGSAEEPGVELVERRNPEASRLRGGPGLCYLKLGARVSTSHIN